MLALLAEEVAAEPQQLEEVAEAARTVLYDGIGNTNWRGVALLAALKPVGLVHNVLAVAAVQMV